MKGLKLQNGDIVIGSSDGYQMVTGVDKLRQDLNILMREPFGCDRFHPKWGSQLIDFVGETSNDSTAMKVKAEIGRLLQNYIGIQREMLQADTAAGTKPRFSPSEIIGRIAGVDVRQKYDSYQVKVAVQTLSGQDISVVQLVNG